MEAWGFSAHTQPPWKSLHSQLFHKHLAVSIPTAAAGKTKTKQKHPEDPNKRLVFSTPNALICRGDAAALGWRIYTPPPPPTLDEDEIKELPCRLKFPNTLIVKYQERQKSSVSPGKVDLAATNPTLMRHNYCVQHIKHAYPYLCNAPQHLTCVIMN